MKQHIMSKAGALSICRLGRGHQGRHRGTSSTSKLWARAVVLWTSFIDMGQTLPRT
jgi:hypothetical protein